MASVDVIFADVAAASFRGHYLIPLTGFTALHLGPTLAIENECRFLRFDDTEGVANGGRHKSWFNLGGRHRIEVCKFY